VEYVLKQTVQLVVYIYKPMFLLGLCFCFKVVLLFGHIWKVKQLTTLLVTLHSTLVCCALINDSFLNQCYSLGLSIYLCVYVDVGSIELSFNLLALCLQCVCLSFYIHVNPKSPENLLGVEQVQLS